MDSAIKEFYSRIVDKLNGLQVERPEKIKITSNPKLMIKEQIPIIHNQRKATDLSGAIKEIDILKIFNIGKWKLKEIPSLK